MIATIDISKGYRRSQHQWKATPVTANYQNLCFAAGSTVTTLKLSKKEARTFEHAVLYALVNKTLSSACNTTSNFKTHLSRVHKKTPLVTKEVPALTRGKRKRDDDQQPNETGPTKKQCTLSGNIAPSTRLRQLLSNYIIEDMLPLSTVESTGFRSLINGLCPTQVPDRKSFTLYLDQLYDQMVEQVKETLDQVDYVSTTVDVWSAHKRSFMGMTAHWIDQATLKRRKAALACTRIVGRHMYDVLGANIEQIHNSYGLTGKITATITDNGSNFVKAFAVFHQTSESVSTEEASSNVTMEEDPDVLCDNIYTDEATFENMDQVLTADIDDELTQVQYDLPAHERCAAHTLNLVASTDIEKHLSTSSSSRTIYRSALAKCSAIWNKVNQSTVCSRDS